MLEDANLDEYQEGDSPESGDAKTWGTSFKADGTKYATSLFWQPLRNSEDPYTEISEAAENVLEGADLFCVKRGKSPQFGLCIADQGYQKGTPVAAVSLINALPDTSSFLAVFKVDGGWWYICVRNDVILSDGDMLFFNEQEAKDQFSSMLAVPDWGYKIAPAEWGLDDTSEIEVSTLLKTAPKETLQKIHALRGTKLIAVIIAAIIVAIWLLSTLYSTLFNAAPPKPVVAPIAVKTVEQAAPPPEPKPWESIPIPAQLLGACFTGVKNVVGIATPGWNIGGVTCTTDGLVTSWHMAVGRLSWIDKALNESGVTFSSRSISPSGTEVVASVPIAKVPTFNSAPKLNGVELVNTINDLFQGLQMGINLSSQTWTSPQNNVYKMVKFSFSSKHDPDTWVDILTKFSGLTINVIKYDSNTNTWYYEGAIYVL